MDSWQQYKTRINSKGSTIRGANKQRESRFITDRLFNSLAKKDVLIDGEPRTVAIIDSDNLNEKYMCSLPGEDFMSGQTVQFADTIWLITMKDFNNELYTKVKLEQCNHILKWIDRDTKELKTQNCIVYDGTKYLTGEWTDNKFIMTRGDTRIQLVVPRNDDTKKFERDYRFIIDDPETKSPLAYTLSKSLRTGNVYEGYGVYSFVLQEVAVTDNDNLEEQIADYYLFYPRNTNDLTYDSRNQIDPDHNRDSLGRKSYL